MTSRKTSAMDNESTSSSDLSNGLESSYNFPNSNSIQSRARQAQEQSCRFKCFFKKFEVLSAAAGSLCAFKEDISYMEWSLTMLYIETVKKKTVSFFSRRIPSLVNIEMVKLLTSPIEIENVKETWGSPRIDSVRRQKKKENVKKNTAYVPAIDKMQEHKTAFFQYVYEHGRAPPVIDPVTKSIDFHRLSRQMDYDMIESLAKRQKLIENYDLVLYPTQRNIKQLLSNQSDRGCLWVVSSSGCTGKSEMAKYLENKMDFQILRVANEQHLTSMIDSNKAGYVFDIVRSDFKGEQTLSICSAIESIKSKCVRSTKYASTIKYLTSGKVVVFSNDLPNLVGLSIDRWEFYHMQLGY